MLKKFYLFALLLIALSPQAKTQTPKEISFKAAVTDIVQKFTKRDSAGLAKYIDKKTGVYLLHRIGVFDQYKQLSTLRFSDSTYPWVLLSVKIKMTPLNYGRLPKYDCEKWTKFGAFVDTTYKDHILTKTALNLKRYNDQQISQAEMDKLARTDAIARKVMIVNNNDESLIFHLSYINNKWFLTIIDTVTTDCST